jgi:hypothetical protein
MASEYGYCTVANLESFAAIDYSAVKAAYTDTVIESWISQAEVLVNQATGSTYTGTIPTNIKYGTMAIAKRVANNQMADDGMMVNNQLIPKQALLDADVLMMISKVDKDFYASGVQGSDE